MPRSARAQSGSATLESMLVLPFLLSLCVTMLWLGGLAYRQVRLAHATHEAARAAAVQGAGHPQRTAEQVVHELLQTQDVAVTAQRTAVGGQPAVAVEARQAATLLPGGGPVTLRARSVEVVLP